MLTRDQASDIFDRIKKLSSADEVEVLFSGGRFALTRFANNTIHQNVEDENHIVSVRTVFGGRTARATTNKFDDESLRRVVESSEALAKVQHPDPRSFAHAGFERSCRQRGRGRPRYRDSIPLFRADCGSSLLSFAPTG